jgi:hypothetical protein
MMGELADQVVESLNDVMCLKFSLSEYHPHHHINISTNPMKFLYNLEISRSYIFLTYLEACGV